MHFLCEACSQSFKNRRNLKQHIVTPGSCPGSPHVKPATSATCPYCDSEDDNQVEGESGKEVINRTKHI